MYKVSRSLISSQQQSSSSSSCSSSSSNCCSSSNYTGLPNNLKRSTAVHNVRSRNWSKSNLLPTSQNCCAFGSNCTSPVSSCVSSPTSGNSSTRSSTPPSLSSSMTELWPRRTVASNVNTKNSRIRLWEEDFDECNWSNLSKSQEVIFLREAWKSFLSTADGQPDSSIVHFKPVKQEESAEEKLAWEQRVTRQLLKELNIDPCIINLCLD